MTHIQQIVIASLILGFAFGLLTGTLIAMFIIERPFNWKRKNKMANTLSNAIELWSLVRAHREVLSKMDVDFSTQAMLWRTQRLLNELAQMIQDLEAQSENKPE